MRVFISWSGDLSKKVALVLRKYLPCMIQDLEVFMSKHDLQSGVRWSIELAKELESSNFGLLCLTADNLGSAWLLFEAGALTKHADGRACCLLIGDLKPSNVAGPLAQFQNRAFEKEEIRALFQDLNQRLTNPLDEASLQLVFNKWWSDIEEEYRQALVSPIPKTPSPQRTEREILDEVLLKLRNIERSLETSGHYPSLLWPRKAFQSITNSIKQLTPDQLRLLAKLMNADAQGQDLDEIIKGYPSSDAEALEFLGLLKSTLAGQAKLSDEFVELARQTKAAANPGLKRTPDGAA